MKNKKQTILLLVLVFFTLSQLNFSRASGTCQGDDVITECSLVDCYNLYNNIAGECINKADSSIITPSYCIPVSVNYSPNCQNSYTEQFPNPLDNNTCSPGHFASQTTQCSTYTQSNCDAQYSCTWTPDQPTNEISCSKTGSTTTLSNTINTQNDQTKTDSCSLNTANIYSCAQDEKSITTNTENCNDGCESINPKCKTIQSYSCSDPDQKSTETLGTATFTTTYSDDSTTEVTNTDSCSNEQVKEYYCPTQQSEMSSELITCQSGFSCLSGVCKDESVVETKRECLNENAGTQTKITYSDNSIQTVVDENVCLNSTTLTKYSCDANNNAVTNNINCPSGCENNVCLTQVSYWANSDGSKITQSPAVTDTTPQEVKLIIKNVGNKEVQPIYISEGEVSNKIETLTPVKEGNDIIATYTFNSQLLEKLKKGAGEFTFYFTSSLITESPEIKMLIQNDELICPTVNTENYENGVCDKSENGILCPKDCFIKGDSKCQTELNENIFSSFYDCGGEVNKQNIWVNNKRVINETILININELGKKSFTMVVENEEGRSEDDFELIAIKSLSEYPIGNFKGIKNGEVVSYAWSPTIQNFKDLKEIPTQTKFKFFFRINGIQSTVLNVELKNSVLPSCTDGEKNGDEEEIDCGGSCTLSCDEKSFCSTNTIVSCSSYTKKGEDYCNSNSCNLYSDSNSTCYWNVDKCERKNVGATGTCYYTEQSQINDTCTNGFISYNYDANFISNEGEKDNITNEEKRNCVPIVEPVACKSENIAKRVYISLKESLGKDKNKTWGIVILGILALLILYVSFITFRKEGKIKTEEKIKMSFNKNEKEVKEVKEKKIKEEKSKNKEKKAKKEIEMDDMLKDFEMGI